MHFGNQQIKEFCEAVKDACCHVDMDGKILAANDTFCTLVGYSLAELLTKRGSDLTPANWLVHEETILENEVKVRGFSEIYEKEYRKKDGTVFPVELMRTLVRDDNEAPVGMFAIVRDLTARKLMQAELLATREEYRALAENSPDILLRFDKGLRHIFANPAAARACGIPVDELVGKTLFEIGLEPACCQVWRERLEYVFRTRDNVKVEDVMPFPDGNREFEYHLVPEGDKARMPVSVLVVGREITERNRAAAELILARQELETRVTERTLSLQNALQEQESFSYTVSHDLRAPLRHINGYLAMLDEEFRNLLPPGAQQLIERTRLASSHMGKLIDDLLELARVSRTALSKAEVDLSTLAAMSFHTLREGEPLRQVQFLPQHGLKASGDSLLLKQVLDNLLGNAWKYSAKNPAARIEFGCQHAGGEEVFFVQDNGAGFDMAFSDQLFRPFQRLHGAEYEGNGIGLATAKRIIDRHGGRIWGESEVGRGSTFYFTLP